jgi:cyclophilin family peptidyl-prolyl cis-trans isomerase
MVVIAPVCMAQVPESITMENQNNPLIKVSTDKGEMFLELFPDSAPKHVDSMLKLVRKNYYDGLTFHRVVPNFVIQGGCPKGDGTGGPGYTIPAEFNKRPHNKGTLAMARTSDPNSAGSQFYICLDRIPHLDNQYTVFGQIVKGEEVPEKIKMGDKMKIEIIQDLKAKE